MITQKAFIKAAKLTDTESIETVIPKENPSLLVDSISCFSSFLSWSRQNTDGGSVNETHSQPLIHACVGCRDLYFNSMGFLLLAMRFYPQQLLQLDDNRMLPLFIAVSSVNHDKKDCNAFCFDNEVDFYECAFDSKLLWEIYRRCVCANNTMTLSIILSITAHTPLVKRLTDANVVTKSRVTAWKTT